MTSSLQVGAFILVLAVWLSVAPDLEGLDYVTIRQGERQRELAGKVEVEAVDGGVLLLARDGALWPVTKEDLVAIANLIRGKNIALFSDEPYCHMVWHDEHRSILAEPGMFDHAVAAAGTFDLARPGGQALCRLTIANQPQASGEGNLALTVAPGCDPAVTTLKLDGWSMPWYSRLLHYIRPLPIRFEFDLTEREPYGLRDERVRALVLSSMQSGDAIPIVVGSRLRETCHVDCRLGERRPAGCYTHPQRLLCNRRAPATALTENAGFGSCNGRGATGRSPCAGAGLWPGSRFCCVSLGTYASGRGRSRSLFRGRPCDRRHAAGRNHIHAETLGERR
jgi:hypothetical protein